MYLRFFPILIIYEKKIKYSKIKSIDILGAKVQQTSQVKTTLRLKVK